MRYQELVARLSEVTRTLVTKGDAGVFDFQSSSFHTRSALPDTVKKGAYLMVTEGETSISYPILEVNHQSGVLLLHAESFLTVPFKLSWGIYEAGVSERDVRKILFAFPRILMECEEGERVRTYLGTFRITRRKRKRVRDPQGQWTFSEEKIIARIRPGKRLQRELEGPPNALLTLEEEDLDEDP